MTTQYKTELKDYDQSSVYTGFDWGSMVFARAKKGRKM